MNVASGLVIQRSSARSSASAGCAPRERNHPRKVWMRRLGSSSGISLSVCPSNRSALWTPHCFFVVYDQELPDVSTKSTRALDLDLLEVWEGVSTSLRLWVFGHQRFCVVWGAHAFAPASRAFRRSARASSFDILGFRGLLSVLRSLLPFRRGFSRESKSSRRREARRSERNARGRSANLWYRKSGQGIGMVLLLCVQWTPRESNP